jgi:hypothetical protein
MYDADVPPIGGMPQSYDGAIDGCVQKGRAAAQELTKDICDCNIERCFLA